MILQLIKDIIKYLNNYEMATKVNLGGSIIIVYLQQIIFLNLKIHYTNNLFCGNNQ